LARVRIELTDKIARKTALPHQTEYVGEVLQAMGRCHARGQLHLDEPGQGDDPELLAAHGGVPWVGKGDRLGLSIAGEVSREKEIDQLR
jgi:hypothetical protein